MRLKVQENFGSGVVFLPDASGEHFDEALSRDAGRGVRCRLYRIAQQSAPQLGRCESDLRKPPKRRKGAFNRG